GGGGRGVRRSAVASRPRLRGNGARRRCARGAERNLRRGAARRRSVVRAGEDPVAPAARSVALPGGGRPLPGHAVGGRCAVEPRLLLPQGPAGGGGDPPSATAPPGLPERALRRSQ